MLTFYVNTNGLTNAWRYANVRRSRVSSVRLNGRWWYVTANGLINARKHANVRQYANARRLRLPSSIRSNGRWYASTLYARRIRMPSSNG
jgi:hypothetical protein